MIANDSVEWLEADGLGGFASGTVGGVRTRRYHALLLAATSPPTGRVVLVNGVDVTLETPGGAWSLSSQRYHPGVEHPDGSRRIVSFAASPWPTWEYGAEDGTRVRQEILAERDTGLTLVVWTLVSGAPAVLSVRPFLSGRDYHSTHHENASFRFDPEERGRLRVWRPYDGVPAIAVLAGARYRHQPEWFRQFLYTSELERGLDAVEDLAAPGVFSFDLSRNRPAVLALGAGEPAVTMLADADPAALAEGVRETERQRRSASVSPFDRAAAAYVVRRGRGRTIVAGYPWFTDWGRDTFIAIRGLCIATGRLDEARDILLEWSGAVSDGMLPNRFPDAGEAPEFNAVDASLWFIIAVHELLDTARASRRPVEDTVRRQLETAVRRILEGYSRGTRFGIRMTEDGLLAAGVPGWQLTWMDARVGDRVITPRIGKPVEVQALWINALWIAARIDSRWSVPLARAHAAFTERFWNASRGCLFDVVDVNHEEGSVDSALRPNQVLALGGLPLPLVEGERARGALQVVERELLTPTGLRSLARGEEGYAPRYEGAPWERDARYHQGTVWPWLIGPFVEAWLRVRGDTPGAKREARRRFYEPLVAALDPFGLGHVCEITDAEPPFTPRGCPFQAWSLGEAIRLDRLLTVPAPRPRRSRVPGVPTEAPQSWGAGSRPARGATGSRGSTRRSLPG